jgi:hypothetical protein
MSEAMEFGFDDAKVIKHQGIDQFKLSKAGERARISVISFKKFHDSVLSMKTKEKGAPLTDEEKAGYIAKIDAKLAENLKKEVKDLTEVDRLDIKQPRFLFAYTHFDKNEGGVGTIRCLSKYEGNTVVKPEMCCDKFGDAEQTVGTVVMQYPTDDDLQVELEIFKARKMTSISVWRMSSKKFKNLESTYVDARNDKRFCVDLRVQLEGDPKYKNLKIEVASGATWAREDMDAAVRHWVLDQGLRAWKHVANNLGFEMSKDKLAERLSGGGGKSSSAQIAAEAQADQPKLVESYDSLLT